MQSSVGEIRRRLLFLLLRAFVIVLFLSFLFFTFIVGYFLTSSSTPVPFPFVSSLEGYYLAKGNWDGAETVFESTNGLHRLNAIYSLRRAHRISQDDGYAYAPWASSMTEAGQPPASVKLSTT